MLEGLLAVETESNLTVSWYCVEGLPACVPPQGNSAGGGGRLELTNPLFSARVLRMHQMMKTPSARAKMAPAMEPPTTAGMLLLFFGVGRGSGFPVEVANGMARVGVRTLNVALRSK